MCQVSEKSAEEDLEEKLLDDQLSARILGEYSAEEAEISRLILAQSMKVIKIAVCIYV